MHIKLRPPEDHGKLIIRRKMVIAKDELNIPVRGNKVFGFHLNFLNDFRNVISFEPVVVSIENFKTPIRGNRYLRKMDQMYVRSKNRRSLYVSPREHNGVFDVTKLNNIRANKNNNTPCGPTVKSMDILT